jgi:hypothetical protein
MDLALRSTLQREWCIWFLCDREMVKGWGITEQINIFRSWCMGIIYGGPMPLPN